jgi:hypothetical protein
VSALLSCTQSPPASAPTAAVVAPAPAAPPPPPITGLPATFSLKQRSQLDVPGTSGAVKLSIDDITRGKVQTTVRNEKDVLLPSGYLAPGDRKTFDYKGRTYELTLAELNNALIGEDFATFKLAEVTTIEAPPALTESQKIDRLIARVESLEGAKFIRNGTAHSPKDAAKHLREKRDYAGDRLKTAEEFIDQIGTRSSLSGDEYEIRFSDGRVMKAGDFLKQELKKLSAPAPAKASSGPLPTG